MVGVHGGSKGCERCRKRKVKCDEARPICKRCEKGGYDCGGYRDLFQFDSRSSLKATARSQVQAVRNDTQWKVIAGAPSSTEASLSPPSEPETEVSVEQNPSHRILLPAFLSLQPFSENVCVSYTNVHLLKGAGDAQETWAIPGITSFSKNSLVRDCILALSFSFFGQQCADEATVRKGVHLYGSTLVRLNGILSDKTQNRSVPTLESIMVLTLYEVLMGANMESFVAHVLGLEVLLKLLGPVKVSQSRAALDLLESSRSVIVSACTLSIKATILASPEWKTIPWSGNLKEKSDLQKLYDSMVDLPGLTMHVWDPLSPGFRLRQMQTRQDLDILYLKAVRTLNDYNSWYVTWKNHSPGRMWELAPVWSPSNWHGLNTSLPWQKIWHFSSMAAAQAYTVYQAGVLILTRLLYNLEQSNLLRMDHSKHNREPELQHAAVEICRSVEWLLSKERRAAGGLYLLMPSRCAWKTFAEDSPERRWMLAAARDIGKSHRGGWSMANPMSKPSTVQYQNPAERRVAPLAASGLR